MSAARSVRDMTVAVVGTGRMGSAMARALANAGASVVLHNRTAERARSLAAELAGRAVATPAEAAAASDVAITMLADDDAVRSVFVGRDGLVEGVGQGSVLVDMSTVHPDTIRSVEARTRATGAGLLDSPVSGSTAFAQSGTLTLMVGGTANDLERARPALDALAKTIYHLGPLGSGAAMKLAVNTLVYGLNGALSEGLVLAEAAGIDRALAYDVITSSAAGAPFVGYKRAAFLEPETTPVAFSLELAEKDLRLIGELAASLGVDMPQAATNLGSVREASSGGRGSRDLSTVAADLRSRRTGSPVA
jgi:3-hydroxyisobutyrate dehydrogenase-like beta-hydroxyacid dehydrogenase